MGYQNVERVFDIPQALINPTTRLTLLSLAERANDETHRAWPGNADFIQRTSLDRSTIWRVLRECQKQGVLVVTPPHTSTNKQSSNLYEIKWQVVADLVAAGVPIGATSRTTPLIAEGAPSLAATTSRRTPRPPRRTVQQGGRTRQQGGRPARPKPEEPEKKQSENSQREKSSLAAGPAAGVRARQPPRLRDKAGTTSTPDLVRYFSGQVHDKAQQQGIKLLDPVNEKGLGGQVNRWLADGVSQDEVRAMMDHFLDRDLPTTAPVWKAFASRRSILLQQVRDVGQPFDQRTAAVERYGGDYYEEDD